jgi:hypothetical protein
MTARRFPPHSRCSPSASAQWSIWLAQEAEKRWCRLDKIVGAAGEDSGSRNCLLQLFESNAKNCLVDGVLDEQMTGAMAILIIRL